jgi:hypothetical protein
MPYQVLARSSTFWSAALTLAVGVGLGEAVDAGVGVAEAARAEMVDKANPNAAQPATKSIRVRNAFTMFSLFQSGRVLGSTGADASNFCLLPLIQACYYNNVEKERPCGTLASIPVSLL